MAEDTPKALTAPQQVEVRNVRMRIVEPHHDRLFVGDVVVTREWAVIPPEQVEPVRRAANAARIRLEEEVAAPNG